MGLDGNDADGLTDRRTGAEFSPAGADPAAPQKREGRRAGALPVLRAGRAAQKKMMPPKEMVRVFRSPLPPELIASAPVARS